MEVPVVDINAKLKIEESEVVAPEELPEGEKRGQLLFGMGTVVSLLILFISIGLGYLYFKMPIKVEKITKVISPTPTVTVVPKKREVTFEIQNASGISGQAAKKKLLIEKLGYKVLAVGNGEGKHTGEELYLSNVILSQKEEVLLRLKTDFPKISYVGELNDSTATARLVLGK